MPHREGGLGRRGEGGEGREEEEEDFQAEEARARAQRWKVIVKTKTSL